MEDVDYFIKFGQLQLEVHAWPDKKFPYFLKWWEMLEAAGLRPFWTEVCLGDVLANDRPL